MIDENWRQGLRNMLDNLWYVATEPEDEKLINEMVDLLDKSTPKGE